MQIGTDIVAIGRIELAIQKRGERFLARFLNPQERERTSKVASIAGLWAAKEAIAKALGCGIGQHLSFADITILKTPKGAPYFELSIEAQRRYPIVSSSLSISHDGGFAIAVVVLELNHL
jgi:holo-[acyl-carrier protein] synthase